MKNEIHMLRKQVKKLSNWHQELRNYAKTQFGQINFSEIIGKLTNKFQFQIEKLKNVYESKIFALNNEHMSNMSSIQDECRAKIQLLQKENMILKENHKVCENCVSTSKLDQNR